MVIAKLTLESTIQSLFIGKKNQFGYWTEYEDGKILNQIPLTGNGLCYHVSNQHQFCWASSEWDPLILISSLFKFYHMDLKFSY